MVGGGAVQVFHGQVVAHRIQGVGEDGDCAADGTGVLDAQESVGVIVGVGCIDVVGVLDRRLTVGIVVGVGCGAAGPVVDGCQAVG